MSNCGLQIACGLLMLGIDLLQGTPGASPAGAGEAPVPLPAGELLLVLLMVLVAMRCMRLEPVRHFAKA